MFQVVIVKLLVSFSPSGFVTMLMISSKQSVFQRFQPCLSMHIENFRISFQCKDPLCARVLGFSHRFSNNVWNQILMSAVRGSSYSFNRFIDNLTFIFLPYFLILPGILSYQGAKHIGKAPSHTWDDCITHRWERWDCRCGFFSLFDCLEAFFASFTIMFPFWELYAFCKSFFILQDPVFEDSSSMTIFLVFLDLEVSGWGDEPDPFKLISMIL